MTRNSLLLTVLALAIAASAAHADLVALKKSPGLTVSTRLDSRFATAITAGTLNVISGPDAAGDTDFYFNLGWAQSNNYCNWGAKPVFNSGTPWFLSKFKVQALPGFAGGRVNKAQLRFYYTGGNTGLNKTGYVISSDWIEGTGTGQYPGAAGGASAAHPMGHNTNQNQNTNGGTTAPLQSWANNDYFAVAKDVSAATVGPGTHNAGTDFVVYDVTSFVQLWANGTPNYGFCTYDNSNNYSVQSSETTLGATYQPVLCIDYDQHGTPNAVTNLATTNPDWFKLTLTWTAPSANPSAAVGRYDIRMSTSAITDDASFSAATQLTGVPTPAAPGTTESFTVTGLSASTTYYFAMKSYDVVNTVSPISNFTSGTTNPLDVAAPDAITNLAAPNVKPNYVVLTWTAVGDDGAAGLAGGYDLRYSTNPIVDDASFAAATAVTGMAAPKAPGATETITVHSLMPSTTYWFAIKARDEVPNWSSLSNVVSFTTPAEDLLPPTTITNLVLTTAQIQVAYLTWTAPADQGPAGIAGYDIRYGTSPITDANWASATQITGEPTPASPGTTELFTVTGLTPSTTYYFAIKSFDYAEPSNVSALSNVVSGTTMPPVVPVTVHNPWISNNRVADTHNLSAMAATYVNAYTPDGVVAPANNEAKAINMYNNQKRRMYHWADEPPSVGGNDINDPTYNQNVFGWALCGRHACNLCTIAKAAGFGQRKIAVPGDWQAELIYDGTNHLFHTMITFYVMTRGSTPHIASCDEIQVDNNLVLNAVAEGRACPGFLLCGDTAAWEADAVNHYSDGGDASVTTRWTGNMDLRLGQSFKRTWESWVTQRPTPSTNSDGATGADEPYHHEANKDWKDTVNFPYWEPYALTSAQSTALNIPMIPTFRRWANGTDTLAPDFRSAGYQSMLESTSHDLATWNSDALSPDLHVATVGTTAEAVFKISVPYYITDANVTGDFVKTNAADICAVYVSTNGTSWTKAWDNTTLGTTHLASFPLRGYVFGAWQTWYVKVQLKSTVAKSNAGVSNLVVTTIFEHNKGSMAYLDKGLNTLTLSFDNAAELQASRNLIHVYYKWKEFDGADWTIDQHYEGYFAASPSTFTIATSGTKVPRTEYILMEVVSPPNDAIPPAAITTLAAGTAKSAMVPLTWTATGDNGSVGMATAYDVRYSTSPIVDDATFNAAAQAVGLPSPKAAGSAESCKVLGLAPLTTYYFAIKAIDKGSNRSPLSNVVSATTPAAVGVTDLAAGTPTSAKIPLTWTAIDDGSTGTETSYDLRYSTSEITEANFAAATQVTGMPAPKAVGSSESFTVVGLAGNTTYWFALKGVDAFGTRSPLSNIITATTPVAARVTDLASGTVASIKVALAWTAIDDGNTGKETSYDLRYSTSEITEANFASATQVTGLPAPKVAGAAEGFMVTGLTPSTTYWFAIQGIDGYSHRSPLSNVLIVTTCPPDVIPPKWIGNLKGKPSTNSGAVDLTWTAPADYSYGGVGPFTCSSYELRYSTSPIAYNDGDASWNAATAVSGLAAPKAPGQAESCTVTGLTGGTTYYFAIKSKDDSNNVSEVSNAARAKSPVVGERVLQNGLASYAGCLDAYLLQNSSVNYGVTDRMMVCGYGDGNYQRGLVKFDVSSLAGLSFTSVKLYLYSYNQGQTKGISGDYGAYPVTTDWTYNQCTWTLAKTGVNWTVAGGDYLPTADATSPKQSASGAPVANVWYGWDVTARVQSWLAGASTNLGWIIKCTDESKSNQDYFYQSDTTNATLRPKLVISDQVIPVTGDISGDLHVNVIDLLFMSDSWAAICGTDRSYDPQCDFNSDGNVDLLDLLVLANNWGR